MNLSATFALALFGGGLLMVSAMAMTQESELAHPDQKVIEVHARGTTGQEQIRLIIDDQTLATWTLTKSLQTYQVSSDLKGPIRIEYFNDDRKRDVRLDYLKIDGHIHQAEDQSVNTAAFQNGKCGGGKGRTEWMRCNGYIEFQTP